jgi:hypothetical protein
MYHHPETMLLLANETQRARFDEADRNRLLAAALRHRRSRRAPRAPVRGHDLAGTLAGCAPSAVPAR